MQFSFFRSCFLEEKRRILENFVESSEWHILRRLSVSNLLPSLKTPQRSSLAAFIICLLLALAGELTNFQFLYGITFCFTGIVSLAALRLLGYWKALLLTALVTTAGIWLHHPAYHYIFLLETAVVGMLLGRKHSKLLSSDALFWLIAGIPILYVLAHTSTDLSTPDKILMASVIALNGFSNAFFAQILYQYLPLHRIGLGRDVQLRHSLGGVLLHLSIGIVLCSFLLNIFLNSVSSFKEASMYAAGVSAREIDRITARWNNSPVKPHNEAPLEQLAFLQSELSQQPVRPNGLVLHIVDTAGIVVASGSESALGHPLQHVEGNDLAPISSQLFLSTPPVSWHSLSIRTWHEGYFIYKGIIPDSPYEIYAVIPISGYTHYLFSKYIVHLLYMGGFTLIAALLACSLNRWLVNSLTKLARATTNLPLKLNQRNEIAWPTSSISEVQLLVANFKHMSAGLVQLFAAEQTSRERLEEQARLLRESEERLNRLAYFDVLTDLPNRLQFTNYAQEQLGRFLPGDKPLAIMFADINRFKQINDTLGHDIGDVLLQQAAVRFSEVMAQQEGKVFRLGGDEFVFVVQGRHAELEAAAQSIIASFNEPFLLDGHSLFLTVSLGISVCPADGNELDALVRHADIAMYNAKEQGDGCYRYFSKELVSAMTERMQLENELYSALKHRQFSLHYQPKIQTATGELCGLEALIRWQHPELGMIPPDKFIPLAEQSGFILEIDKWVFHEACRQNKEWQLEGLKTVCVSVNISARHFYQGNLVEMVELALKETGLEPQYVSLEITEGVFMQNMDRVIGNIQHLRGKGIQISVDDFGTGYSSLNQLQRLPISDVKLDRSFIQGITADQKKSSIVKAIIELVHSMNMKVVAEGVETEEESRFCAELRCDELQGYLFSKPLPADQLAVKLGRTTSTLSR
jgi:diguanylate cyclase (GGDEF)-like protein